MKSKISQAYSSIQKTYSILGNLKVTVSIAKNPYSIPPDCLFTMAARQNKKRGFLFVSKVLGKHIPVKPHVSLLSGAALGALYLKNLYGITSSQEEHIISSLINGENLEEVYSLIEKNPMQLPETTLFLGMAETATALGHSVFRFFEGNGAYIHTTRDLIKEKKPIFDFQEEHSHATTHRLYSLQEDLLEIKRPLVIIDDEITTGKTALNLIEAIHRTYPRDVYTVMSLLDWRSEEDKNRFKEMEKRLGVTINTIALISGTICVEGQPIDSYCPSMDEVSLTEEGIDCDCEVFIHKLQKKGDFFSPLLFSNMDNNNPYIRETGRFSTSLHEQRESDKKILEVSKLLKEIRKGNKTLCLGTGEFMYIPMMISANMGEGVVYHSTTRSPVHPNSKIDYGVKNAFSFPCPYDDKVTNYFYNIPYGHYDDLFVFFEREMEEAKLQPLLKILKNLGIPEIHVVFCMGNDDIMVEPDDMGSYSKEDVIFVLKDISKNMEETGTEDREEAIQGGIHYSEMLPLEYKPSEDYMELFYNSLEESTDKLAIAVGVVSERILKQRGSGIVIVSLARAGTPIGILIKRYYKIKYNLDIPHFSISIIRGKGIDENAIRYILKKHPDREVQFVDGWTGKGAIAKVLTKACIDFENKYGIKLDDDLAVLADPGYCVKTYGTREDFLIASSCLNSTVSGLVSRTVHRQDLISERDFHGAKFYKELIQEDVSNIFIDRVTDKFLFLLDEIDNEFSKIEAAYTPPTWQGWKDIESIKNDYGIEDINLIKPGIGETTRVLLRRIPWKILVKREDSPNLKHILLLAKDKNVSVEVYQSMTYECCGLIKPLESD